MEKQLIGTEKGTTGGEKPVNLNMVQHLTLTDFNSIPKYMKVLLEIIILAILCFCVKIVSVLENFFNVNHMLIVEVFTFYIAWFSMLI